MLSKTILLIIASQGYQAIEYGHTRKVLEDAKVKVIVASNEKGTAYANPQEQKTKSCGCGGAQQAPQVINRPQALASSKVPNYDIAQIDIALSEVNADDYDGIFVIGGPGAMEHLDNEATHNILKKAAQAKKPIGAICISPRILAHAGLLKGRKATGWDGDSKLTQFFNQHNVIYLKRPVVIDGNIITANGPQAALDFGKAILSVLRTAKEF